VTSEERKAYEQLALEIKAKKEKEKAAQVNCLYRAKYKKRSPLSPSTWKLYPRANCN